MSKNRTLQKALNTYKAHRRLVSHAKKHNIPHQALICLIALDLFGRNDAEKIFPACEIQFLLNDLRVAGLVKRGKQGRPVNQTCKVATITTDGRAVLDDLLNSY